MTGPRQAREFLTIREEGKKVWWCSLTERTYKRTTPDDICVEFHRRRKCGWRLLIPIPDQSATL